MFEIRKSTLYSLDELADLLPGRMTTATLLDRLGLRKSRTFRDMVWGWEILEASRRAKPFSELGDGAAAAMQDATPGISRSAGRKGDRSSDPVRRLTASDLDD